ncbi:AzlD domain-containing protein [Lachnoanaerobaculum gingivalis]|jgi:branched-chain amino acid transport protein (azlD)|uniref:AzlD domain-containing protein n=1 Tax=Lachnoanaerobaculum gingivalis TaxID=2490855 RepID=UPI0024A6ACC9|nr:AzlD domain-containing protein [Lachnoanaerobaculum gingivalis]WHE88185.1 AzlD domain-containing protein [Lachnoanaerobaculum gingivalis]
MNKWIYIFIMFAVTYMIRVLPLTIIRKKIKNAFIRSFLYYVPYVTLSVMTFPAILNATMSKTAALISFIAGIIAALFGANLFKVALLCCSLVLIIEYFIV